MAGPSRKEGLRCECGKLLLEEDPEMGFGVRCGRHECGKFHKLSEINKKAAEFENQKNKEGEMEGRPNFGPLQIRIPEEIKRGMIVAVYDNMSLDKQLKFMRVIEPQKEDLITKRLRIKVECEYASGGIFSRSITRGVTTETLDLSEHGVVPYNNGTWCDSRCLVKTDQNGCIPDELSPKNYTPEAEERRKAKATGRYTRECKFWRQTVSGRGLMLESFWSNGKCAFEDLGLERPRDCGRIYAGDCPNFRKEDKKEK